ncbi:MAG: acyl-CoA dehydrogenase family protein [Pseudomonadota bacterium]
MTMKSQVDVYLKKEDHMLRDVLRKFVNNEIVPIRQQVDDDKEHVLVHKVLQGLTDLGIQKAPFPEEYGGSGAASVVTNAVVHEELGRGDSGICTAFNVTGWAFVPALAAGNKAVLDRFAPEFCGNVLKLGCFSMTEPGGPHGGGGCDIENVALKGKKIRTTARLDGDEWVINGRKMWASNSGIANAYCVVCTTDPGLGDEGIAIIYVPGDSKGLTFGKNEKKAGMQGDKNHAAFLDDVRVPKEFRAAGPGQDGQLLLNNLILGRLVTAALAVGQAQGAFETVLKYTGERVVADKPIRDHSVAACILADMAVGIETARQYAYAAAYMYDHPGDYGPPTSNSMLSRASIAKMHACDVAVSVTNKAMELMGAYGYVRDYDVEKYWRDCKMIQLWVGGGQLGRLDVCRGYYDCG